MFNLTHILYLVISNIVTIIIMVLCGLFIKQDKYKRLVLKICAILTVIIHFSSLYVDFFKNGGYAEVESPMLFPKYPCNVMMWLLLICAFKKDLTTKFAKVLLEFTFYAGVFCGMLGVIFNENFGNNPTLADWDILKGMLSHTTMIMGSIYILVGGFIKIRVSNCFSALCGLLLFLFDGLIINGLYKIFKLESPNSMYLESIPFDAMPWLNTYIMGIFAILLVFIITALYEQFALKKEDRWYTILKTKFNEFKQRRKEK